MWRQASSQPGQARSRFWNSLNPSCLNEIPKEPLLTLNFKALYPNSVFLFLFRVELDAETGTITVGPGLLSNLEAFGDFLECQSTDPRCLASRQVVFRLGDLESVTPSMGGVSVAAGGSFSRTPPDPSPLQRRCGACGTKGNRNPIISLRITCSAAHLGCLQEVM